MLSYCILLCYFTSLTKSIISSDDSRAIGRVNVSEVVSRLKEVLRDDQIELNDDELRARGKPWNSYHKSPNYPNVIVMPETTGQRVNVLAAVHDN